MQLDERFTAMHVLDVSGHGVAAALLSVSVRHVMTPVNSSSSLLRELTAGGDKWRTSPPTAVAAELNRRFPLDLETGRFFTLLYGLLDAKNMEFRYVSAGHPGPVHLTAQGTSKPLGRSGPPIGTREEVTYHECCVKLASKDRVYVFSDGVLEATDKEKRRFAGSELLQTIQRGRDLPLQESLNLILERVQEWAGTKELKDDASLLALEIKG